MTSCVSRSSMALGRVGGKVEVVDARWARHHAPGLGKTEEVAGNLLACGCGWWVSPAADFIAHGRGIRDQVWVNPAGSAFQFLLLFAFSGVKPPFPCLTRIAMSQMSQVYPYLFLSCTHSFAGATRDSTRKRTARERDLRASPARSFSSPHYPKVAH